VKDWKRSKARLVCPTCSGTVENSMLSWTYMHRLHRCENCQISIVTANGICIEKEGSKDGHIRAGLKVTGRGVSYYSDKRVEREDDLYLSPSSRTPNGLVSSSSKERSR